MTARERLVAGIRVLVVDPTDPDAAALLAAVEQQLDALVAEVRAATLTEAADAIDQGADDLETQAIANDGHAYGRSNRTVAAWRDAAAVPRRMAADPTAPTPSKD